MSSVFWSTGTSFATGLPRLVMMTDWRLDWTSSMTLRQWTLKTPAGMVFMGVHIAIMVVFLWSNTTHSETDRCVPSDGFGSLGFRTRLATLAGSGLPAPVALTNEIGDS